MNASILYCGSSNSSSIQWSIESTLFRWVASPSRCRAWNEAMARSKMHNRSSRLSGIHEAVLGALVLCNFACDVYWTVSDYHSLNWSGQYSRSWSDLYYLEKQKFQLQTG